MRQLVPALITILTLSSLSMPAVTMANTTPKQAETRLAQRLNCNNAQTQREITQCADLSYKNADKKLNQVYKQLLPKLSGSRRQKLITAQQLWLKFRDANCEFVGSQYEGGTLAPAVYAGCLEQVTKQRTQQLQEYLQETLK
ncbi:lysozyme inhibitor LprI family protein [Cylindrospermum sp. FACHB-282]|uniref:lysozyme inhibitor LprI family protein n=1 Tax=Cylindrospermum sp. FACHB-282 TaxID=2692794 RepID=UPI001687B735|nr:lysozyme inhibitor LprI family protein [Cylindrospermum sp. FACHB-282]MBD2386498.1 lysozyme inhibitor LprI family protein [Cylindrospermum sp. FACHB-282]